MRGPTRMLLDALDDVDDEQLRMFSARLFLNTTWLMFLNVGLYLAHIIDEKSLILVTLILSWMAVQFTCAQTIIQTDIKKTLDQSTPDA